MSERRRAAPGAALWSHGFRPFFLFGAGWAALALALFLASLATGRTLPSHLTAIDWHVHELLYGALPAVVAGFLLTAVPNWTRRLPIRGGPLIALVGLWAAGRLALLVSGLGGDGTVAALAAVVDLAFLAALLLAMGREIIAGRNGRNLKVLLAVGLLLVGNGLFHWEALTSGTAQGGLGLRIGIAAMVLLIVLIGGRIVPSFTRNWLAARGIAALPAPLDGVDVLAICLALAAVAGWTVWPDHVATALLCLAAAAMHLLRLCRWQGHRTLREPLLLVLHVGYGFVPLGFLAAGLSALVPAVLLPGTALHVWTVGAFGTMTLAVMVRASLGHTGRPLSATPALTAIFGAIVLAALARLAYGLGVAPPAMLMLSGAFWLAAYGGFVARLGPLLCR